MIGVSLDIIVLLIVFSFIRGIEVPTVTNSTEAGIIVCSGDGDMFNELLGLLFRFHSKKTNDTSSWKAPSLPMSVAHCDELSANKQQLLKYFFPTIGIIDICANNRIKVPEERLKGFFCKTMALIHSPYANTIIMDTDVIWLEDPITLLDYSGYKDTGTLYFRDRLTFTKNKLTLTAGKHVANFLVNYLISVSTQLVRIHGSDYENARLRNKTELMLQNVYWRHYATGSGRTLDHMQVMLTACTSRHVYTLWSNLLQDSSVIVFNPSKRPRTTEALRIMIKDFNKGYGDKEIYWLASTIANEDYSFEPYLAGSLGDCGAIVHFSPNSSQPMYINAEYLIDRNKIKRVGDFLGKDVQITLPKRIIEQKPDAEPLMLWQNMEHGFYPCGACKLYACKQTEKSIVNEIKERQRLELAFAGQNINVSNIERIISTLHGKKLDVK